LKDLYGATIDHSSKGVVCIDLILIAEFKEIASYVWASMVKYHTLRFSIEDLGLIWEFPHMWGVDPLYMNIDPLLMEAHRSTIFGHISTTYVNKSTILK